MNLASLIGCAIDAESTVALIESIAETPELTETETRITLAWPQHGLVLNVTPAGTISAIYLRPASLSLPLPGDLSFAMSRAEVLARMGPPSLAKAGTQGAFGLPGWDRYDTATHSLHVQYRSDEAAIECVSVLFPQPPPASEAGVRPPADRK